MRKILFLGIVLLVALEILVSNADWINYKLFLAQIVIGLLLFISAVSLIKGKDFYRKTSLDVPLIAYIVWVFISFFFSPFKSASTYGLYNIGLLVVFYFLVVNSINEKKDLNLLVNIWLLSALFISIRGVLYHKGMPLTATFGNPNLFAAFLVSTIPFALFKLFQAENKGKINFYFFLFIFLFIGLYLTKSRSGIGAGIASILLFIILWICSGGAKEKTYLKALFLILVLFLVLGLVFYKKLVPALDLKGREYIWRGAWQMIKHKSFFGYCIGNFVIYFPQFAPKEIFQIYPDQFVNNAHNEFLTIATELGIVGLAIFLWFLLRVFLLAKKNIISQDRYLKTASIAAISSITGIILINLFDVSLRFVFTALFWWLAVAILVISNKLELKRNDVVPKKVASFFKPVVLLFCVGTGLMFIYNGSHSFCLAKAYNKYSSRHIVNLGQVDSIVKENQDAIKEGKADAKIYLKLGTIYARKMDWQNARNYLEKAIEMDRNTNFAYNNLGNVYFYLENIDKAIDCYHKAIAINPGYLIARYNLGFAYFKKIQIKDAMKELDFILAKDKNDFQAWQMRQLIFE